MEQKDKVTIFHLYRHDGTALFLHPFENLDKLVSVLQKNGIEGKYGKEPRVESLTLFRNDLYRLIEDAVKSWVSEKRFIPRFLASAVVFLLTYLFMSIVIRDPLPLVDEILIGLAAAFVTYFLMSRRDQRSNSALKKRVELRTAVDRIVFKQDPFVKEIEDAPSKAELITRLRARGLLIVSINEISQGPGKASTIFSLFSKKRSKRSSVKSEDLAFFTRNLSTTLSSGVTLLRSLEILAIQSTSGKLEKILKECSTSIKEGLSLSEAVAKYPNIFSALWVGLIEVGEASGNLPFVLEKLSDYIDLRLEFEREMKSAMVYPSILLFVATGAVIVFFKLILPKFTTLFEQFDVKLPLVTQWLFSITKAFEVNFLAIMLGGAGVVVGVYLFIKRPETRAMWDNIKMRFPLVGELVFLSCIERMTSTMYILLDSGLPLVYTLEVASKGVGNSILEKSLQFVTQRVRDGASLSGELSRLEIFPLLVSEMAKIGEETGTMPQVFKRISNHYQRELTTLIKRLISAFEPIMIVFIGLIIGGIVIALFLPLFKISTMGS